MAPVDMETMGLRFKWGRPKPRDGDVTLTFDPDRYFTIDGGKLEIANVGLADSGKLECIVSYHGPGSDRKRQKILTYDVAGRLCDVCLIWYRLYMYTFHLFFNF